MFTSCPHCLTSYHRHLRSDLLDLHNGYEHCVAADTTDAVRSLVRHGFNECNPDPDHWILCRGSQRVHLYGPDELTRFARRYAAQDHAPNDSAVPVKPQTSSKETTS